MKAPKILFFIDGFQPTPDDMAAAAEIAGQVCFRNARVIPSEGSLEACDGVAGAVPATYKKLPTAAQAIKSHGAKVKALKQGDSPAPSVPASQQPATGDADPATGAGQATDAPQGAQDDAGAGEAAATDAANVQAPGAAPDGAAGTAWKSN